VMIVGPSTSLLQAHADTCGAEHASPAKFRLLKLLTPPAHESEGVALLHQGPRGEETLVYSARNAEAFSLLEAEAAARAGLCVLVGEVASGENFGAGETGEAVLFLVAREELRFDEEFLHLWASGLVVWVD
jgi:hypothetical protein